MIRPLLAAALALAAAATPAAAQAPILGKEAALCEAGATPAAALLIQVRGFKVRTGTIRAELYPANERDFLSDKNKLLEAGKLFRRVIVDVPAAGPLFTCLGAPAPGPYALAILHDPDGKRGFNAFKDGAGFPGDPRLGLSRPPVAKATIFVGPGVTATRITLQYLRGLSVGPVARPAADEAPLVRR